MRRPLRTSAWLRMGSCLVLTLGVFFLAGCQAAQEEEPVWYYVPGHDTFYSEPDDVYLVWDGRQWVQLRSRPGAITDEDVVPLAEVAPTPFAQWAPHPRSHKIPFDYEPYPYLQFRFSAPPAWTPEHPRPHFYDERPYPYDEDFD